MIMLIKLQDKKNFDHRDATMTAIIDADKNSLDIIDHSLAVYTCGELSLDPDFPRQVHEYLCDEYFNP